MFSNRIPILPFMVAGLLTLSSCGGDGGGPSAPVSVASVTVSPGQFTMVLGQNPVQFLVVARDASGNELSNRVVTWSMSNSAVATVSATGVVTAVGAGSVAITATSEGQAGSAALLVVAAPTVTALSSLGVYSVANGINDGGTIVGGEGGSGAVKWTFQSGAWTVVQLPDGLSSTAAAINATGDIVGNRFTSQGGGVPPSSRAVLWPAGGGAVVLGCAAVDSGSDAAVAINSGGTVAGTRNDVSPEIAVVWRPGQCREDLPALVVGKWAEAFGIDDAGNVSGFASDSAGNSAAVRWAFNGTSWNSPETLKDGRYAGAEASNSGGDITGGAIIGTFGGPTHAVLWPSPGNSVRKDLGTLGNAGSEISMGYALNSAREVVGWSYTSSSTHAFIWSATTGMLDLSLFAPDDYTEAHGINNAAADGSRLVIGFRIANSGTRQAVVWRVP
jgi:probable HAF family extracellular repeat protein